MMVAGVDPGTINAGVCVLKVEGARKSLLFSGTIRAGSKDAVSDRLVRIYTELKAFFEEWKPDILALENVFYHKDFQAAVCIGEARAAAMIAARECQVEVAEYPPARVKQSVCGNGRARKDQIQYMVRHILNIKGPMGPDAADAIAVALCHVNMEVYNRLTKEGIRV